jgi:hypothetical protein
MATRKIVLGMAIIAGVVAAGLIAGRAQASAPSATALTVYNGTHRAPVATKVSPQVLTTTYTFSTATSPILGSWNQGWWSLDETNNNGNTNYFTGSLSGLDTDRGFFTFDITGWTATNPCTPASAYLTVPTGVGNQGAGFGGPAFLSAGLFDVATDPFTLAAKINGPNAPIYNDLGSGFMYGGPYSLSTAASFTTFTLPLNFTGLNALASSHMGHAQYFSIGTGLINPPGGNAFLYGDSGYAPVTLTVSVPKLCKVYP